MPSIIMVSRDRDSEMALVCSAIQKQKHIFKKETESPFKKNPERTHHRRASLLERKKLESRRRMMVAMLEHPFLPLAAVKRSSVILKNQKTAPDTWNHLDHQTPPKI